MKVDRRDPPRRFTVRGQTIAHTADIELAADEQVTFVTGSGTEYDVARKAWGYYATPSLNGRLVDFNLRAVLVKSDLVERFYIHLVERGREAEHAAYCRDLSVRVVLWLDDDAALEGLVRTVDDRD